MVTTSSFFLNGLRNRNNVIEDGSIDDIGQYSLAEGEAKVQGIDTDTRGTSAQSNDAMANDAASTTVVKRKRKLKRQRDDSDSDDGADEAAAAMAERIAREEQKKRRIILDNLETLASFLKISKNMMKAAVDGFGGGDPAMETQIRETIRRGGCAFIHTRADLSKFEIAEKFRNLKLYQQCGVHWLSLIHSVESANGILADEMGLGKTAQASVFLSYLYSMQMPSTSKDFLSKMKLEAGGCRRSTLILVPLSVLDNWCNELKRWAPNLKDRIVKYHGAQSARFQIACDMLDDVSKGSFAILVSTMATVSSKEDIRMLRGLREFEYMIVDEAHSLKNSETIAYRRLNGSFNIRHRLLITGTPIQNRESELGNLIQFAMPELFDQFKVNAGINYLIEHYKDAVNEFPDLASLVDITEIEDYKRAQRQQSQHKLKRSRKYTYVKESDPVATEITAVDAEESTSEPMQSSSEPEMPDRDTESVEPTNEAELNSELSGGDLGCQIKAEEVSTDGSTQTPETIDPSIRVLQRLIAPFILRRKKRTVMHELPEKRTLLVRCKMTGIQLDMYMTEVETKIKQNRDTLVQKCKVTEGEVLSMCNGRSRDYSLSRRDDFLVKSMVFLMRRICNHPLLVRGAYYKEDLLQKLIKYYWSKVEGYKGNPLERVEKELRSWSDFEIHRSLQSLVPVEPRLERFLIPKEQFLESAKVQEMFKIIDRVEQAGKKALIFSQFTMYLDLLETCLGLHKPQLEYLRLDGGHNPSTRTDIVERFTNDPNITLLLISTKAGGTGLNLTVASTVILMDLDWNPHNDAQAENRSHRIGQTEPVDVYKLMCEDTIEEYIWECCQRKLLLDDAFSGKNLEEDQAAN
ncbi:SNF2 family N-terminal domain containing protein [Babesia bovis T2Bo]|uniref:SNF2 family N-terminal domain containing protein n=1 Tax=Babesia bovis TaxID=5865 RepID=A7AMQ8_BABBO|nr:SNF2 family N-terminal domain containing protein [Babesia bovis T2Bo]EDO07842.1 SNF2 family N-terminal domain containing protein [Babesia bovis T2Bo]|eukprot:XP_001611410.1 SNF2 family N-terminal domain containing protein [Babesia bovis T2Bo]